MNFIPHTQEELKQFNIQEGKVYSIEYKNTDYFNGEQSIEKAKATAIINENKIVFIVPDPFGMDRFIDNVKVCIQ